MNQIKIGKFISELRKEKNMTQKDLAIKLNVTDRAISNWENGRRMPDISLFKPLCETLNITINELLSGEKIPKEKIKKTSEELLIKTLKKTKKVKKKSTNIIIILIIISIILITGIFIILKRENKRLYPQIDIYSITVNASDPDKDYELKKEKFNNQNIYYYGIDSTQICNSKDYCYNLIPALTNKQTDIKRIKEYLDSQLRLGNINSSMMYDGGTRIYNNEFLTIMFCNTTEGNKDIYIGLSNMVSDLNGAYCGREEHKTKSYTRTYYVTKAIVNKDDSEFIDITLKNINNETGTVTVNKSTNITVGKVYEFSFYTFDYFEDNIENIFKYSTLLNVIETTSKNGNYTVQSDLVTKNMVRTDNVNYIHGNQMNEVNSNSSTYVNGRYEISTSSSYRIIGGSNLIHSRLHSIANNDKIEVVGARTDFGDDRVEPLSDPPQSEPQTLRPEAAAKIAKTKTPIITKSISNT